MPFTLKYLHTQAKINQATEMPEAVVPDYTDCTYVKKGPYVDFVSQGIPINCDATPWRFNIWVEPEDLEITFQIVSRRLLNSQKGAFYFSVLDPSNNYSKTDMADQFTLYTYQDNEGNWAPSRSDLYWSLCVIERQLHLNGVRPGVRPDYFQSVNGSRYITIDYQRDSEVSMEIADVMKRVSSAGNPFRLFAAPAAPMRIDYESIDEFREAKEAAKEAQQKSPTI